MAKKTKKNKKAKRAKYTTAGRVDMSKGGRVKMARGSQAEEKMLEDEIQQFSVQPTKKRPTGVSITPPSPEQQPMPDSNQPVSGFDTMPVDTTPAPLGDPRVPTTGGRKGVDAPRTPEELQRLEELSYVARGIDEDLTSGRGDAASLARGEQERGRGRDQGGAGPWWAQNGYDSLEAAIADGWSYNPQKGWTQSTTNNNQTNQLEIPSQLTLETTASPERLERIKQTGIMAQERAEGIVPEAAVLKPAVEAGVGIEDQKATVMADPTAVSGTQAEMVAPERVTTVGDVAQAQTPEQIQAAQMQAAMVDTQAQVEAAQGAVSDQAIAQAAGVDRVAPIEGAEVEIPEGALAERVIGTLSEGAKSTAATNAGSSLSRITRAKKQLSNAGLSDSDIAEIGNDPEALEDRLAEFSEEDRGIIEGLPQEALVSTQLSSLLEGIENGNIPPWASPAVARVEQMLAARGMSASTVGRDALLNTIMQAALPIAQSNAQAIQASVSQQKTIEAAESEANAARMQQTALANADNVFKMDMAQFSADQQTNLFNSKFLQTVGLTEANMDQQSTVQNAMLMSQANLAEANFNQQAQIRNAQAFLQMDMANLNTEQQANVLRAQQTQQRILSNQAADNASRQFNAASENQTQQFMANLETQTNQFNASQNNAMAQFNANSKNAAAARDANRRADINKFNSQLLTQVEQFNSQQDFARNQWNAQNAAVVEASNVQWRRQTNLVNTAAQNQINMQNAMNAFNLSNQSMSFLWQELRDQADFDWRSAENTKAQITQLQATAIANEGALAEKSRKTTDDLISLVNGIVKDYYST